MELLGLTASRIAARDRAAAERKRSRRGPNHQWTCGYVNDKGENLVTLFPVDSEEDIMWHQEIREMEKTSGDIDGLLDQFLCCPSDNSSREYDDESFSSEPERKRAKYEEDKENHDEVLTRDNSSEFFDNNNEFNKSSLILLPPSPPNSPQVVVLRRSRSQSRFKPSPFLPLKRIQSEPRRT